MMGYQRDFQPKLFYHSINLNERILTIPIDVATQFRCNPPPNSGGSRHLIPVQSATPLRRV